jgi:hypothetical protein
MHYLKDLILPERFLLDGNKPLNQHHTCYSIKDNEFGPYSYSLIFRLRIKTKNA